MHIIKVYYKFPDPLDEWKGRYRWTWKIVNLCTMRVKIQSPPLTVPVISKKYSKSASRDWRHSATINIVSDSPHLLDPRFSLSSSFLKLVFKLSYCHWQWRLLCPKKDLLSSPGANNLLGTTLPRGLSICWTSLPWWPSDFLTCVALPKDSVGGQGWLVSRFVYYAVPVDNPIKRAEVEHTDIQSL